MIEALVAATLGGLAATAHCAAMCGPIAVAGACNDGRVIGREAAGYLLSRLVGYATVGAALGAAGQRLLGLVPVGPLQIAASLSVAAVALARAIRALRDRARATSGVRDGNVIPARRLVRRPPSFGATLLSPLVSMLPRRGVAFGAATAFLPCGALVPAWLLAASTTSPTAGAATMAAFSIASVPGLAFPMLGAGVLRRLSPRIPAGAEVAGWLALAAWMIARPLLDTSCCAL